MRRLLLTALAFLPIGQLCGRLMNRRANLRAYGLNLLGSMIGVVLISLAALLWTPPAVWFGVAALSLLVFLMHGRKTLFCAAASAVISA